jgi:hypothetical protein
MEKEFNVLVQAIDKGIASGVYNRQEVVYLNDVMAKIDANLKKAAQEKKNNDKPAEGK